MSSLDGEIEVEYRMKQMIVNCGVKDTRMLLLDNNKLVEFASEQSSGSGIAGSFYKGKVMNVLPGMQAAFVDIGQKKNAFLYIDDVLHAHLDKQPKVKPSIADLLKPGQEILVQVTKEPYANKGARITTHYSLPGRWIVYMPEADYIAVSKKISTDGERARLRQLGSHLKQGEEGLILRTVAEEENDEAITNDLNMLRQHWQRIRESFAQKSAPAELHRDLGMVERLIRDVFNPLQDQLIIDNQERATSAITFLQTLLPANVHPPVSIHTEKEPIFHAMNIHEQLHRDFQRKVWLQSGGYIVWDQTEAFTVIDVNTGKFTGGVTLEDTVTQTNLQAASEIARLLRLRDTGGIIIIDFIDMDKETNRRSVVEALEIILQRDRTKTHIVGWTRLGLLELTRKKVREETGGFSYETCTVCQGTGKIASWIKD